MTAIGGIPSAVSVERKDAGGACAKGGNGLDELFREKSVERISSPEDLDDYIRVTTPSVWIVLAAILILLIGMLAWSVFGTVEVPVGNGSVESVHPISFVIN